MEFNTTMTVPNTRKDKTSPAASVLLEIPFKSLKNGSYRAPSRVECMKAKRTLLGYQKGCQLKEAVVDQEGKEAHVSFDGHERPRMQQAKTREQGYRKLLSEPRTLKQNKLEWWRGQ